jgi:hypothetical protein
MGVSLLQHPAVSPPWQGFAGIAVMGNGRRRLTGYQTGMIQSAMRLLKDIELIADEAIPSTGPVRLSGPGRCSKMPPR